METRNGVCQPFCQCQFREPSLDNCPCSPAELLMLCFRLAQWGGDMLSWAYACTEDVNTSTSTSPPKQAVYIRFAYHKLRASTMHVGPYSSRVSTHNALFLNGKMGSFMSCNLGSRADTAWLALLNSVVTVAVYAQQAKPAGMPSCWWQASLRCESKNSAMASIPTHQDSLEQSCTHPPAHYAPNVSHYGHCRRARRIESRPGRRGRTIRRR